MNSAGPLPVIAFNFSYCDHSLGIKLRRGVLLIISCHLYALNNCMYYTCQSIYPKNKNPM